MSVLWSDGRQLDGANSMVESAHLRRVTEEAVSRMHRVQLLRTVLQQSYIYLHDKA